MLDSVCSIFLLVYVNSILVTEFLGSHSAVAIFKTFPPLHSPHACCLYSSKLEIPFFISHFVVGLRMLVVF